MNALRTIVDKIVDIMFHCLVPNRDWWFFTSFHGQYNDNPKYISEKLREMYPEKVVYWEITEKSKQNDIPKYVRKVYPGTIKYHYIKNKCAVVIDNYAGFYMSHATGIKARFVKKLKNAKQFNLSTAHGSPFKKVWIQDPESSLTEAGFISTSDLLIAGSDYFGDILSNAVGRKIPMLITGTPRNDIFFIDDAYLARKLKNKLGLPLDKKVILYAPTYRNTPIDSGVKQIEDIDFGKLFSTLTKAFGGEWVFVFRLHNLALKAANIDLLTEKIGKERFVNGNQFDDMMEYLAISDILITDYSSCFYDWTLTDKPCFLYAHDRDEYENHGRGFYNTVDFLPYTFSNTFDELLHSIDSYNAEALNKKREAFLTKIGNREDGNASERVIKTILERKA